MAAADATEGPLSPNDLLSMPDGKSYELIRGRLTRNDSGAESAWIGGMLLVRLVQFVEEHGAGWVFPSKAGYQCFPHDPGMVRRPRASFVKKGRFPGDILPEDWITIVPDLAVEVVSPRDRASELDEKLVDYRVAGIPLTWVIYPESRSVMLHRHDGSVARLLEADSLSGEEVLPGFLCPIREVLPAARAGSTEPAAGSDEIRG